MYEVLTLTDIEEDLVWLFRQIERDIGAANDDEIMAMDAALARLAFSVNILATETTERSCFAVCQQYLELLRESHDPVSKRLLSN